MWQGDGIRHLCAGGLAGGAAGLLFGLAAERIQNTINHVVIARYGAGVVLAGSAFGPPSSILIPIAFIGCLAGLLYVAARSRFRWLGRAWGLLYATLLVLALFPLLSAAHTYFSAVAIGFATPTSPSGFRKIGPAPEDISPPLLLGSLMAGLLFVQGLATHVFTSLGARRLPHAPAPLYVAIVTVLGLAGLYFLGLILVFATGAMSS